MTGTPTLLPIRLVERNGIRPVAPLAEEASPLPVLHLEVHHLPDFESISVPALGNAGVAVGVGDGRVRASRDDCLVAAPGHERPVGRIGCHRGDDGEAAREDGSVAAIAPWPAPDDQHHEQQSHDPGREEPHAGVLPLVSGCILQTHAREPGDDESHQRHQNHQVPFHDQFPPPLYS